MKVLFSLDLGNKQAKLKSSKKECVRPSRFVNINKYGKRDLLAYAMKEKTYKAFKSSKSEVTYAWGEDLKEGTIDGGIVDTMGFGVTRYTSDKFKLLVDFALAELAIDFAGSKKSFLLVDVETGIPTEDYFNEKAKKALEDAFMGDHLVTIEGAPVNVRVESVTVTPQPTGTIINEIADMKGNVKENPLETANIGVVDVGGGTFLADAFRDLAIDDTRKVQLPKGAYMLFLWVKNALSEIDLYPSEHEIEKILKDGMETGEYWYSPDGAGKFNISKIVMEQRKIFTDEIIGEIFSAYRGFGRMQLIFITGGGANLLIKERVEQQLQIVYFVEHSEMANVRGFYKQGLIKAKQQKIVEGK